MRSEASSPAAVIVAVTSSIVSGWQSQRSQITCVTSGVRDMCICAPFCMA